MNFFNTYLPCKELQDVVELYWHSKCELEQSLVQEMYTPILQALTFNMSGRHEDILLEEGTLRMDKHCYLIGQPLSKRISLSNPYGIDILGVKFTPLGIYLLTGIDMKHISDKIIDACDIWNYEITLLYEEILGKKDTSERIAAIERFLRTKKMQQHHNERIYLFNHALHQMEHNKIFSVSQIRENNFITKKTFERYFLNGIGVTPKQYANISRFNSVRAYLDAIRKEPDWHDIVVNFGYYDQSHLVREFKRYTGKTPTEYCLETLRVVDLELESNLLQIFS